MKNQSSTASIDYQDGSHPHHDGAADMKLKSVMYWVKWISCALLFSLLMGVPGALEKIL